MTAQPHEPLTQAEFPAWELRQEAKMELSLTLAPAVRPCRTYGSDMLIEMATSWRYADVVVKLVVEVLSESTAKEGLGMKMREYQAIDTLQEYVLIDSRNRWAQVSHREANNRWELLSASSGVIELRSVGVTIDLEELYTTVGVSS